MIEISVKADVNKALGFFDRFGRQVPFATAVALTRTARQGADEMRQDFEGRFDRPTRYTLNSIFSSSATKQNLVSSFGVKDNASLQKSGGLSPADVLAHHFAGGVSRATRYEQAFRRIGMLGANEDIVPARELKELDQYGNVPASFIVRLISYFSGFGEQGYKANATQETRAKLAKRTDKNSKGARKSKYVRINGVVYFYASGAGTTSHLHRGIWAKTGIHGVDIRPVLMFVGRANYRKRFDMKRYAQQAQRNFTRHFDVTIQQALGTAR